jgi:3-hydroxyisobutyrate dehydrogenase-like beta-hydroxyacid dehydrogenase
MRVAVLGLGIIGSIWADNLRQDGVEVRCWNRTAKDVPGFTADPAAAVAASDLAILVVADPPAVEAVVARILPALAPGKVLVQSSTISAACTRAVAEQVAGRGAAFLDAPFTGSKPAAQARQTVFYAGGEAAVLERARPVLARLSKAILHIGPIGAASSLKLAMNLNLALACQALGESLALARAAGIDDAVFFDALHLNAARSALTDLKEPKLRARDFSPQFSLKHMGKDLRLALAGHGEAGHAGELALAETLAGLYARALASGWGDEDFSALSRLAGKS